MNPSTDMTGLLARLFGRKGQAPGLSRDEAFDAMTMMMSGKVPAEQVAAFLGAIAGKGVAVDELVGMVTAMRAHAKPIDLPGDRAIDTCGTGGTGLDTFNVSTIAAFILAAGGHLVVKHGNRSASGKCGGADLLERLGVNLAMTPEQTKACALATGFGFVFARSYHPAMAHVAPIRSALKVKTVFNILGPLSNPAAAKRQVIGVYDPAMMTPMAKVLRELGSENVLIVHGGDGTDEITLAAETAAVHLCRGEIAALTITPEDFGLPRYALAELLGGDVEANHRDALAMLTASPEVSAAKRDLVIANSAAALWVAGSAATLKEGRHLAEELLNSGKALAVLKEVRRHG